MSLPRITSLIALLTLGLFAGAEELSTAALAESEKIDVYVIPITDAISQPNLFVLRRGLKEAIANDVEMVLLDMDTPGGRVDVTLEMMRCSPNSMALPPLTSIPTPSPQALSSLRPLKRFTLPLEVRWVLLQSFKGADKKYPRRPA